MRKIWNKGHRIRASDKHLVHRFSIGGRFCYDGFKKLLHRQKLQE